MHFDAVIVHYICTLSYLLLASCSPIETCVHWHLSGMFKCIFRRGSPHYRRDFLSRMHQWEERYFPEDFSESRSTAAQMYSTAERFLENLISWALSIDFIQRIGCAFIQQELSAARSIKIRSNWFSINDIE